MCPPKDNKHLLGTGVKSSSITAFLYHIYHQDPICLHQPTLVFLMRKYIYMMIDSICITEAFDLHIKCFMDLFRFVESPSASF